MQEMLKFKIFRGSMSPNPLDFRRVFSPPNLKHLPIGLYLNGASGGVLILSHFMEPPHSYHHHIQRSNFRSGRESRVYS